MKKIFTISSMLLFISTLSWSQWTMANMSEAKTAITPVTFGNKVLFVGGKTASNGASTSKVEKYDAATDTWSTDVMSFYNGSNFSSTVTGNWAVFGKSPTGVLGKIFVYENIGETWETVNMPDTRNDYILASVGNKVMLAGGKIFSQATNKINIYNLETKQWSLDTFAVTRTGMRSITIGERVFFVGGSAGNTGYSSQVDMYDNSNSTWTTINLSQGRTNVTLAVINNKLVVAGGQPTSSLVTFSDVVDYIDLNTLQVSSGVLPDDITNMRSAVIGNQAIFWGVGYPLAYIYDDVSGQWTTYMLTPGITSPGFSTGAVLGNKLYFSGGNQVVASAQTVFIYDGQSQSWITETLPSQRTEIRTVAVGNKVLFAGGLNFSGSYASNLVDIYTDASILPLSIQGAAVQHVSCFNGSDGHILVDAIGGISPFTYSWTPSNAQGSNPSNLAAGTYTVTIEDATGATVTSSIVINQPTALSTTSTSVAATYNDANGSASVTVTGGTPPYSYLWSNGATTPAISNVVANDYTVTITDGNACTTVANVTVEMEVVPLVLSLTVTNAIDCKGDADGALLLDIQGGLAPYAIVWNPSNVQGPNPSNLAGGNYTVTVTDATGITSTATVQLTEPPALSISTSSVAATYSNANGSTSVTVTGGTPNYSYSWNNNDTTATINNVVAGSYTVTVTDGNGCTTTATVTVAMTTAVDEAFSSSIQVTPTLSNGQFSLRSSQPLTGLRISLLDAQGHVVKEWRNIASGENLSIDHPTAGLYYVRIMDREKLAINKLVIVQ